MTFRRGKNRAHRAALFLFHVADPSEVWRRLSFQACSRSGSLDASITEEVANGFPALFARYPNITHVFFNGSKAETAFRRHALPALPKGHHIIFTRLPSTSPANAAMRLQAKVQAWSVLKKIICSDE